MASPSSEPERSEEIPGWVVGLGVATLGGAALWALWESTRTNREVHDREVVRVAEREQRKGYVVAADVKGWPKPPTTNGSRVDVLAVKGRRAKFIEIEHEHTLMTKHTREQIEDIADFCDVIEDYDCSFEIRLT